MKLLIDNSAISLLHCKRRFQLTVIEGLAADESAALRHGSAFHIIQEYIDKGEPVEHAITTAQAKYPDVDINKLIAATTLYRALEKPSAPIMLDNGRPAIEVKFSYPYAKLLHGSNVIEIELSGTIDHISIDDAKDQLVIKDYKTSGKDGPYAVESTVSSYDLSFQLPFYVHALLNSGILPAQYKAYIEEHRYRVEYHFVFYNARPPVFKKLIRTALPGDFISREVPLVINAKIAEAVEIAKLTTTAPHDGMCVYKACDYCPFKPACLSMGTERELEYLSRFERRTYNPLEFR